MTIKQQGGIFGRNPKFNDVEVDGVLDANVINTVDVNASNEITAKSQTITDTSGAVIRLSRNDPSLTTNDRIGGIEFYQNDPSGSGVGVVAGIFCENESSFSGLGSIVFKVGDASSYDEVARINSSGNLAFPSGQGILCGVTSTDRNAVVRADLSQGVVGSAVYISRSGGSTAKSQIEFANSNGVVGSITTSGSATAYNTSSDYRLKTDAQPMTGASDRVKLLSPVNFEWISDGTRVDGFLAHEVQEIVPEAVHGAKDAMREEEYEVTPAALDEDGNVITEAVLGTRQVPDYQAIDQSKLVPVLTAALQEALAKIEQLESRVASLEV
jgi:hypothetical protein